MDLDRVEGVIGVNIGACVRAYLCARVPLAVEAMRHASSTRAMCVCAVGVRVERERRGARDANLESDGGLGWRTVLLAAPFAVPTI